jgi:hypothetical protein
VTLKNVRAQWEYSPQVKSEALGAALRFSTPVAQLRDGDEVLITVDGIARGKALFSDDGYPVVEYAELLSDGDVRFYAEGETATNVASWFATCRTKSGRVSKTLFVGNETKGMSCNATAVYATSSDDVLSWPVPLRSGALKDSRKCVWCVMVAIMSMLTTTSHILSQ